ncbi:colicin transporter [Erwinia sp. E_sp_B04_7]|uniref:colicin transporter n=1 Tax=unclassified Erwinia TaxID=2622719 RepID=UPI0030CEA090
MKKMTEAGFNRSIAYGSSEEFFKLNGNSAMKLTPLAAKAVCIKAAQYGYYVARVEAGHWIGQGFRPDMSATWDAKAQLIKDKNFHENDKLAVSNVVQDQHEGYEAFMITLLFKN